MRFNICELTNMEQQLKLNFVIWSVIPRNYVIYIIYFLVKYIIGSTSNLLFLEEHIHFYNEISQQIFDDLSINEHLEEREIMKLYYTSINIFMADRFVTMKMLEEINLKQYMNH